MVKLVTKHGLYKLDECMNQAMLMKRYDIIKFFLSLGVPSLLKYMSRATNLDLLKEFIKLGGNDWDGVMVNAALAGDLDLVKDMVARGAKNYKPAMAKAYAKNHIDVFIFLFRQIGGDVEIPASLIRPDNDLNRLKKV